MEKIFKEIKKFEKPELEIIDFTNDDIITESFGDPDQNGNDVFHRGFGG